MEIFYIFSLLITLSAVFGYINHRFIKLPSAIGVMFISFVTSLGFLIASKFDASIGMYLTNLLAKFDFSEILLDFMLSFLLFAGAFHLKIKDLKESKWPIFLFSTFSVLISTVLIGYAIFAVVKMVGFTQIKLIHCLLFGSLISPTDPIAVMSILRKAGIPKQLETKIAGESLFNDGVAVVMFLVIYQLAGTGADLQVVSALSLFAQEALGGAALGLLIGLLGFWFIKSIDHYQVEVLLTLSVVMGGYTLAHLVHVSGPLAMVIAGLIIGNPGKDKGMSAITADYVDKFWELIDEIMNGILFVFIGLQFIDIEFTKPVIWVGLSAIIISVIARFISLYVPSLVIRWKEKITLNTIKILTWGGLRGGISIALALSLRPEFGRDLWVTVTYIVACFSILVQGLTVGKIKVKN